MNIVKVSQPLIVFTFLYALSSLFLLAGHFAISQLSSGAAIVAGLLLAGCLTLVMTRIYLARLLPENYMKMWPQASLLRTDSERIIYLTTHDILTGLYNRVWLDRFLNEPAFRGHLFSPAKTISDFSIIIVDINNLRMLNDHFGLETGNRCLNHLANLLKRITDRDHLLARSGGDEFVIIMPDASPEKVDQFLTRLDQTINRDSDYPMNVSWSTASTQECINGSRSIMSLAEERMITDKLLNQNSSLSVSLKVILSIMHERNRETEEHMLRLQNLAVALARKSPLPEKLYPELRLLARLHDIGKMALSDSILQKNGPLDEDEWAIVRKHPEFGAHIVEMIPNLKQLSQAILSHHERWDGKGYPNHLAGEQIPLMSRIISLVDSWDAMTNDRAYRKALPFDRAIQEIIDNSGTQFDPNLSIKFLEIVKQIHTNGRQS